MKLMMDNEMNVLPMVNQILQSNVNYGDDTQHILIDNYNEVQLLMAETNSIKSKTFKDGNKVFIRYTFSEGACVLFPMMSLSLKGDDDFARNFSSQMDTLIKNGGKLASVKFIKALFGTGLKDSKDIVDGVLEDGFSFATMYNKVVNNTK